MGYEVDLNGHRVSFSHHALQRLIEMSVPPVQIRQTLEDPERIRDGVTYANTWYYDREDLTLVLEPCETGRGYAVVTALFNKTENWLKAEAQGRLTADRKKRLQTELSRRPH